MRVLRAIGVTAIEVALLLLFVWLMNVLIDATGNWMRVIAVLAGLAVIVSFNMPAKVCKTCKGIGLVPTVEYVEVHPYQSAAPCPECSRPEK